MKPTFTPPSQIMMLHLWIPEKITYLWMDSVRMLPSVSF